MIHTNDTLCFRGDDEKLFVLNFKFSHTMSSRPPCRATGANWTERPTGQDRRGSPASHNNEEPLNNQSLNGPGA